MDRLAVWLCVFLALNGCQAQPLFKMCATPRMSCTGMEASDSDVECVQTNDPVGCVDLMTNGNADFAVFTPEDMVLAGTSLDSITNVIFKIKESQEEYKYRTVAVIDKQKVSSLESVKGKNFCHPGFDGKMNERVLKFFESELVNRVCSDTRTAVENELDSLTQHFAGMCRPGKWVSETADDNNLKKQYPKLCSVCDTTNSCSYATSTGNHHDAAIRCLKKGKGDVAYVIYENNRELLGASNTVNLQYLCPNGGIQNLSVPCFWYKQPWNAVVAVRSKMQDIKTNLSSWLDRSQRRLDWKDVLRNLILGENGVLVDVQETPSTYVKEIMPKTEQASCSKRVQWCTTSPKENLKCEKLKLASNLHGLVPEISCVQTSSTWQCLEKMKNNEADIMSINAGISFLATKLYGARVLMGQETTNRNLYKSVAVVRSGTIATVADLKNRKACFPEFGGLAYITFLETLRNTSIQTTACPYKDTITQFFQTICLPGAADAIHDPDKLNNQADLCSQCPTDCSAKSDGLNFGNVGAVRCLTSGADVAFIDANSIENVKISLGDQFNIDQYRILCKNGGQHQLQTEVTNECAFAVLPSGVVIGRKSLTDIEIRSIKTLLLNMDTLFEPHSSFGEFDMYGTFYGEANVLFKGNNTISLMQETNKYLYALNTTINEAMKCASGSSSLSSSHALLLSLTIYVIVTFTSQLCVH